MKVVSLKSNKVKIKILRISFIGHSLGGLIIRAALPHLKDFSNKFHFYISLSSPHLGFLYTPSKLIDAGLWFLKKWKNSKCLYQFSLSDNKNITDTFLYKLSETEVIFIYTLIRVLNGSHMLF